MHRLGLGILFIVSLSAVVTEAAERVLINGFEYETPAIAQQVWRPQGESPPVQLMKHRTSRGRWALRLPCDFRVLSERGYWDRDVRWDLSRYGRFAMAVYVENASAVRNGTIYFRSRDGWYGAWFPVQEGWQQVELRKSAFRIEGQPHGWDRIDGIRLSFWKASEANASAAVDELEAIADDIVVVRGSRSQLAGSPEWRSVQQFADQMVTLLEGLGVPFGVIDDTDVETGALLGSRLAIFPYNPDLSDREIAAVREFITQRNGKVMLFYALPDSLAPLLGVRSSRWMREEKRGQFTEIRLNRELAPGLPGAVQQGSWNVRIPEPTDEQTEVLGVWFDAEGQSTEIPAMTIHPNGVFLGHVLLPNDRARKQQLMLALIAHLLPEQRRSLAEAAIRHAGRIAYLADLATVEAFINANLEGQPEVLRGEVRRLLKSVHKTQRSALKGLDRGHLYEVIRSARRIRETLLEAYFRSFPSRPERFRGVWCHSAYGIPGWSWDEAIRHLAEHGFNAIVPNMLWAGVAYYPSGVLPVAPEVAERGDAIADCLKAARKYGMQVHVWKVNWNLSHAPEKFIATLRKQHRLQRDRHGNEVLWLCPSHPENFKLELESMLEVVRKYPVDGIHFDYIRYPNADACYDEGCRERFEQSRGITVEHWPEDAITGPYREAFGEWRQEQITRLVRAVSQEARKIRPAIQISAAVFRDYPNCRETVGQDWVAWIRAGYLDFVCPMDYTSSEIQFQQWVSAQKAIVKGRVPLYPGIGASAPGLLPEQTAMQVFLARKLGADGFILFNYDAAVARDHLPALSLGATRDPRRPASSVK